MLPPTCYFQDFSPLPWSFPFTFLPAFVTTLHFEMIATYPQTSVFAKVSLLSILCPFPSTFLFESPLPFVIPSFNFYLPSEAHYSVCLPPSASLFIRNKVVGSGAFLSQQTASSSWRKLKGFIVLEPPFLKDTGGHIHILVLCLWFAVGTQSHSLSVLLPTGSQSSISLPLVALYKS